MTIGERIKQARNAKGLTQKQLGAISGTSEITIRQYELGKRQPRIEQFQAIAVALGVDVNWLMNGQTLEQRDQAMKDYVARRFSEVELDKRLQESYTSLTLEGKSKAVESVEIIAGNPRYRAETPPPATPEGKDTTPPSPPPESSENGG